MKIILTCLMFCFGLTITVDAQTTLFSENFASDSIPSLPAGWSSHVTAGSPFYIPKGWETIDTSIQLYDHYIPDQAKNIYAVVNEWSFAYNTPAVLTSPVFSMAGAAHPYFSCDYYYLEGDNGIKVNPLEKAWINISTDSGITWTTIDTFRNTRWAWKAKYLNLASYAGASNVRLQFVYTDDSAILYGLALDNINVFDAAPNDIALTSITPTDGDPANDFFNIGSGPLFRGTVFNHGTATITSFDVNYTAGKSALVSETITGVSIPPFTSYAFGLTKPWPVTAADRYPVSLSVSLAGDTNSHNDSATTVIYGVDHQPHKQVLFESGTGTWCGYCVRGIIYMDSLKKYRDTSVNIVEVHTADPMGDANNMTANYSYFNNRISNSVPNIYADRHIADGPENAFNVLPSLLKNFALADMSITNVHIAGNKMNVSVNVTPATNLAGDYRLELLMTEDSVHGSDLSFNQANDYSYQVENLPMSGMGFNFQDSLAQILASSMYYRFVARATVPDLGVSLNGVAGSLPDTMKTGTSYKYTFANVLLDTTNWVARRLTPVVVLINNANGQVYNTANNSLTLGIPNVAAGIEAVHIFPNPASQRAFISYSLLKPGTVHTDVYDASGRLVYTLTKVMAAGRQQLILPIRNFSSGMYLVNISTTTGTVCERLVVEQ